MRRHGPRRSLAAAAAALLLLAALLAPASAALGQRSGAASRQAQPSAAGVNLTPIKGAGGSTAPASAVGFYRATVTSQEFAILSAKDPTMLFGRFGLNYEDNAQITLFDRMVIQSDGTFAQLDSAGTIVLAGQSRLFICSAVHKGEALVRARDGLVWSGLFVCLLCFVLLCWLVGWGGAGRGGHTRGQTSNHASPFSTSTNKQPPSAQPLTYTVTTTTTVNTTTATHKRQQTTNNKQRQTTGVPRRQPGGRLPVPPPVVPHPQRPLPGGRRVRRGGARRGRQVVRLEVRRCGERRPADGAAGERGGRVRGRGDQRLILRAGARNAIPSLIQPCIHLSML